MSIYDKVMATDEGRKAVSVGRALIDATELIVELMQKQGMKRKDLAAKMGVTPSAVTQMLDAEHDMKISTVASALFALDAELELSTRGVGAQAKRCVWFEPDTGGEWHRDHPIPWSAVAPTQTPRDNPTSMAS